MQSLSGREGPHHVRQQEVVVKQEDGNHSKVSSQGRPLAEKQVIGNIF